MKILHMMERELLMDSEKSLIIDKIKNGEEVDWINPCRAISLCWFPWAYESAEFV